MKKWLIALGVLLFTFAAQGQTSTGTFSPQVLTFPGTPTGVCDNYQQGLDNSSGLFYSCNPSTRKWVLASQPKSYTVATLPPVASLPIGTIVVVTDGASAGTCTVGGGTTPNLCYDTGAIYFPLGGGTGTFTGGVVTGTTTFNVDAFFKSGAPSYDVQAYGAVCDGVTDDTAAITAAYNQLVADLAANGGNAGGGGAIHASHAAHPCLAHTLTIPTTNKGWIVTDFDNGLIVDQIVASNFNAFIGHTGNFQGLIGTFTMGPDSTILQAPGNTIPLFDLNGVHQVWIEGINAQTSSANNTETLHCHDNAGVGCIGIHVVRSLLANQGTGKACVFDSSGPSQAGGFGAYFDTTALENLTNVGPATICDFINYDIINFRDPFWQNNHGGGVLLQNNGTPFAVQFYLDNLYTEALNGPLININSTGGTVQDIDVHNIVLSDPNTNQYVFKNTGTNTAGVKVDMASGGTIGSAWIDPSSTANGMTAICLGTGCDTFYAEGAPYLITGFMVPQNGKSIKVYQNAATSAIHNGLDVTGNTGGFPDIGINATKGIQFGDSANFGSSVQLFQPSAMKLDVGIAQNMPPTGMSAVVGAGGSLTNGTYYYTVTSLLAGSNCNTTVMSAYSKEVSATTTTGNNTVTLSWTPGTGTISGYCVYRGTVPNTLGAPSSNYFQTGGSSTGFTDTGAAATSLAIGANVNGTFPANPQFFFNVNSLGINTVTPTYDLDVTHSAAPNSGIRATGVNLTSLSPSSAVCTDPSKNLITSGCVTGGPGTGTTNGLPYWATATTLGSTTPPAVQGVYNCGYTVPSTSTVVLTCPQLGLGGRALTAAATTDTVLYSDNAAVIDHDKAASGAINETLPTATTLNNPAFVYSYANHSGQTDTITPTTWTIQAGTTGAGATLSISPGTYCRIKVDPNSATNWLADCSSVGSVTSFTGDGLLLTNSGTTGAVTATVGTAPANKFWNGAWTQPAFSNLSGSATCAQLPALTGDTTSPAGSCATTTSKINGTSFAGTNGDVVEFGAANIPVDSNILGSNLVRKDAANTGAGAMTLDMSASTSSASLRIPNIAGASSTTAGAFSYDTTNKMPHVGANGVDNLISLLPTSVTPANNDCAKFTVSGSTITLNTAGGSCSGGSGAPVPTQTIYAAAAGLTTCSYNGGGGVSCTPSTNAATCGAQATPCQDFSTVAAVIAALATQQVKGIYQFQFSDVAGGVAAPSGKCYQPSNVLINAPGLAEDPYTSLEATLSGITDAYPTSYLYFVGNTTTPANVIVTGASTCAGTTDSATLGVVFDHSTVRLNGFKAQYFGSLTVSPGRPFAANAFSMHRGVMYADNLTGLGDGTHVGGLLGGWDHSIIKTGGALTVSEEQVVAVVDHSTWYTSDALDTSGANTVLTYTAGSGMNGSPMVFAYLGSLVLVDRFTMTTAGTGSYTMWQANAQSEIWSLEGYSSGQCVGGNCINQTLNAANALYNRSEEHSYIDHSCVASAQSSCTQTAIGIRAQTDTGGEIRVYNMAAGTNPDVINGAGRVYSDSGSSPFDINLDTQTTTHSGITQYGLFSNSTNPYMCLEDCALADFINAPTTGASILGQGKYPLQWYNLGAGGLSLTMAAYSNTNTFDNAQYNGVRSRGTTANSHGAVGSGDNILGFNASADDGTALGGAGAITFKACGTWTTGAHCGEIDFSTHTSAAAGSSTLAWVMDQAGTGNFIGKIAGGGTTLLEGTAPANTATSDNIYADSTTKSFAAQTNGSALKSIVDLTEPGFIRSTALVAAVSTATLCAASAGACNQPGEYHVHVALYQSGTACTSNATGGIAPTLTWTDGNGTAHSAQGIPLETNASLTALSGTMLWNASTLGAWGSGDMNIDTNGTIIQYAIGFAQCSVSGTATYAASLTVTRLQ